MAVAIPVTRFVAPGPLVTRQTPVLPVALAYPPLHVPAPAHDVAELPEWNPAYIIHQKYHRISSWIAKRKSIPSFCNAFTNNSVPFISFPPNSNLLECPHEGIKKRPKPSLA